MLLPRLLPGLRTAFAQSTSAAATTLSKAAPTLLLLRTPTPLAVAAAARPSALLSQTQVRFATHKAAGHANDGKDGPGKRLGAKKINGQPVQIGMIIFRQRGTKWYPGENCGMGRDHTIFALQPGFVRYYRDPAQPDRKFIGVALTPEQKLPHPPNAARKRLLGHVEVPLVERPPRVEPGTPLNVKELEMRDGFYMFRPPNWRIGKVMPRVEVKNNDPFARWRKRARREKNYKLRRGIATK